MIEPDVTIVVPTYGRPAGLRACLEAIAALQGNHRAEVIVVDDGGPEGAAAVVAEFGDRLDIRLLRAERGGPGAARNAGAAVARGRFLAFVDDDCVPAPGWLAALLGAHEGAPSALLGGPVENLLPRNPYATTTQLIATFVSAYYADGRGRERFFPTNNLAVARAGFRELGGFDTSIPSRTAEDKEFCDRWREGGREMLWVPGAVVRHAHDLTLWRFLRQHYNYGRGILRFRLMRRRRGGRGLVPEGLSFYVDLIVHPLRNGGHPRPWRQVLLLLLSQAATAIGAAKAAMMDRPRAAAASRERRRAL